MWQKYLQRWAWYYAPNFLLALISCGGNLDTPAYFRKCRPLTLLDEFIPSKICQTSEGGVAGNLRQQRQHGVEPAKPEVIDVLSERCHQALYRGRAPLFQKPHRCSSLCEQRPLSEQRRCSQSAQAHRGQHASHSP